MRISERSVSALAKIITGDSQISPYRRGPELVRFFNEFGENDVYGQGFPSRWCYTEEKIRLLNGTPSMRTLIREVFDPRNWYEYGKPREEAVSYLNGFLKFDGFNIVPEGDFFSVLSSVDELVEFKYSSKSPCKSSQSFIDQQIIKCDKKLTEDDFDGAITNARSLLEAVLTDVEQDLSPDTGSPHPYDGDLPKLYKRVQKLLNLEPSRTDIEESLKQVLRGLASIVAGLSALRNKMGDAHVRSYQPSRRHAVLVVNAAKTLSSFVVETKEQKIKSIVNLE